MGGQEGAGGVEDEIELEIAIGLAVTYVVEHAQGFDGGFEDAFAALCIGAIFTVMGQTGHDVQTVSREELRQVAVLLAGSDDGQIASVDDMGAHSAALFDKPAEVRIHFGGTTGEVDGGDVVNADEIEGSLEELFGHHFIFAVGTCIDVAVAAGLVAEFSEVEL